MLIQVNARLEQTRRDETAYFLDSNHHQLRKPAPPYFEELFGNDFTKIMKIINDDKRLYNALKIQLHFDTIQMHKMNFLFFHKSSDTVNKSLQNPVSQSICALKEKLPKKNNCSMPKPTIQQQQGILQNKETLTKVSSFIQY